MSVSLIRTIGDWKPPLFLPPTTVSTEAHVRPSTTQIIYLSRLMVPLSEMVSPTTQAAVDPRDFATASFTET